MQELLTLNRWESDFFSRNIYTLNTEDWNPQAFDAQVADLDADLIEARVPTDNGELLTGLFRAGFIVADSTMEFVMRLESTTESKTAGYTPAKPADIDTLKRVAEESLEQSRFDHDIFGSDARQRVYSTWVANAVTGDFDDICLIRRRDAAIAGFVTCRLISHTCRIGLLAVRPDMQGHGVGTRLIADAIEFALEHACGELRVATQYSNRLAVGFYANAGFAVDNVTLWLYRT